MVQRGHHFAIVDEVDFDPDRRGAHAADHLRPARGPLRLYITIDKPSSPSCSQEDYELDEKQRTVIFTEDGNEQLENLLRRAGLLKGDSLYDIENVAVVHHVNQALRRTSCSSATRTTSSSNGEVVIIDEFTGRMMQGRRYSEGLHQALEAKEHVQIQPENQTLASITFQNYFRLYKKLAGMTGTAATEAEEFVDIYRLDVVEIPTNVPVIRIDEDDEVYRTVEEKYKAIVEEIEDAACARASRSWSAPPRSRSPSSSPSAAARTGSRISHQVLNARYHEQEAYIVAQAGVPGAVTIATNMAGRGTDIQLGGNADMRIAQELGDMPEGPEREAKERGDPRRGRQRLKEQGARRRRPLRARHRAPREPAHRQPAARPLRPPGRPRPLEILPVAAGRPDAHLRLRAHGRHAAEARPQGRRGDHPSLDQQGAGEGAEEGRGAQLRHPQEPAEVRRRDERPAQGHLRAAPRAHGRRETVAETVADMRHEVIDDLVAAHIPENAYAEQWDVAGLKRGVSRILNLDLPVDDWAKEEGIADEEIRERLTKAADAGRCRARRALRRPNHAPRSRRRCCCRRSTICGASISSTSTICAR